MLPTVNILTRTFRIKIGEFTGTAFTIDFVRKRYLVTAQHVVVPTQLKSIEIETNSGWKELQVEVVGHSEPELDFSVLGPVERLHQHSHPVNVWPDPHVPIGQEVYFSGFALGLTTPSNFTDFPYPIPLVRRGMLSSYNEEHSFLDGFVNPGMSGGPVFMMNSDTPDIFGVITHRYEEQATMTTGSGPIKLQADSSRCDPEGRVTTDSTQDELIIGINAGMVRVTRIEWVLGLISQNPVGFRL